MPICWIVTCRSDENMIGYGCLVTVEADEVAFCEWLGRVIGSDDYWSTGQWDGCGHHAPRRSDVVFESSAANRRGTRRRRLGTPSPRPRMHPQARVRPHARRGCSQRKRPGPSRPSAITEPRRWAVGFSRREATCRSRHLLALRGFKCVVDLVVQDSRDDDRGVG